VGWALPEKPDAELLIKALGRSGCYCARIKDRNMQIGYFASDCGDTAYARA